MSLTIEVDVTAREVMSALSSMGMLPVEVNWDRIAADLTVMFNDDADNFEESTTLFVAIEG